MKDAVTTTSSSLSSLPIAATGSIEIVASARAVLRRMPFSFLCFAIKKTVISQQDHGPGGALELKGEEERNLAYREDDTLYHLWVATPLTPLPRVDC